MRTHRVPNSASHQMIADFRSLRNFRPNPDPQSCGHSLISDFRPFERAVTSSHERHAHAGCCSASLSKW
eukprot:7389680-Prymnesium_polylepis.2